MLQDSENGPRGTNKYQESVKFLHKQIYQVRPGLHKNSMIKIFHVSKESWMTSMKKVENSSFRTKNSP